MFGFQLIKSSKIVMQKMRQHQRLLPKLDKISETSSPSKEQQSPIETACLKGRINPASLTSSYLKFKRFEEDKQKKCLNQNLSNKAQCETNYAKENHESQSTRKTQTIQSKNQKISSLQESIVRKKMQITLLQDCFQKRSNPSKKVCYESVFSKLTQYVLKFCQTNRQGRQSYLSMVLNYGRERKMKPEIAFKVFVEWVLKIVRKIFFLLNQLLKIPTSSPE